MEARKGRTNTGNAGQFNDNAKGQQKYAPMPSQARENNTQPATGLIHRMLDVPRGCALSPGGRGRASETAQVRGLGYPVSRRPAAGTPAPPAPDTNPQVSRHTFLTAGRPCTGSWQTGRSSECALGEEICRGQSMAICRSGAYLRRSPMASCSGGRFEGRRWASDSPQKEWVSDGTLALGTSARHCFYASLPGTVSCLPGTHAEKCD